MLSPSSLKTASFSSFRSQVNFHLYKEASLSVLPPWDLKVGRGKGSWLCLLYLILRETLHALRINILHLRSTNCRVPFPRKWPDEQSTDSPQEASTWGKKCYLQEQYQMLDSECPALTFEGYQGRYGDLRADKAKVAEQSSFRSDFPC